MDYMRIIAGVCAMLLVACGSNGPDDKLSPEERQAQRRADSLALKVGVLPTLDCFPAYVAKETGVFDSLGVDVRLCRYKAQMDCDEAMRHGRVAGGYTDSVRLGKLQEKYGFQSKVMSRSDMQWTLVANKSSRLKSVRQLTDKMVAMTRHSVTDMLCDRIVDSVRLSSDRLFRIQINDVDLRLRMILNNEMDAAWLPEPQASVALRRGHNALMRSGRRGERPAVLAFARGTMGDARQRRQVELFMKGLSIADGNIRKHGQKHYQDIYNKYYYH